MYKLFSSVILVEGNLNSAIYDLHRNDLYTIPNKLSSFLKNELDKIIKDFSLDNSIDQDEIELLKFLLDNELIFWTDNPDSFPLLSNEWDEPFDFTNAIIDINETTLFATNFLKQLTKFSLHTIQFRFFNKITISELTTLLTIIDKSVVFSVEIIVNNCSFKNKELEELIYEFDFISYILLANSQKNETKHYKPNHFGKVIYITQSVNSQVHCGQIGTNFFTINIKTYTESLHYNSCLNRKISIDTTGNIKNCPSMPMSFGNIDDTTITTAIEHPEFKKYWNINKDKIHVCKECEFRYICTDCRAYVEDIEDMLSKPLKCGYNPYTGEWSEWSTNPLKQKAIDFYGMREMVEEMGGGDVDVEAT